MRAASLAVLGILLIVSAGSTTERQVNAGVSPVGGMAKAPQQRTANTSYEDSGVPLESATTICFGLTKADQVEIKVYDVGCRVVRNLVNRRFEPGMHEIEWDRLDSSGRSVSRGLYFTQVCYGSRGFVATKKLMMIR
jgi:flagellar hook assembly protein FlgD